MRLRAHRGYLFLTGLIRALEARGLTRDTVSRMVKAATRDEALQALRATFYHDAMEGADPGDPRSLVRSVTDWLFQIIEDFSEHREIVILARIDYDYHNLKVLLRESILETGDIGAVKDTGIIPVDELREVIDSGEYNRLPLSMGPAVRETIERYYMDKRMIQIDATLDRHLYRDLLGTARELESPLVEGYYRLAIDLKNITTLARLAGAEQDETFISAVLLAGGNIPQESLSFYAGKPPGELVSLCEESGMPRAAAAVSGLERNRFALEREADSALRRHLNPARYFIRGVEPFFAFTRDVLADITIIDIIAAGRATGIGEELLSMRIPATVEEAYE